MTHKEYQDMIPFYLYDELDLNVKLAFEKHLETCSECKKEFEKYKSVINNISEYGNTIVDDKVLMESRQELRGAIRHEKSKVNSFHLIFEKITSFIIKPSGLAISAITILLMGLLIGYLIFNVRSASDLKNLDVDQLLSNVLKNYLNITDVKIINSNPATGEVEFSYEITKTENVKGNVNDPKVKSLLSYAVLNEQNPGIRLNSLNFINASQNLKLDDELRQTIFTVAKYDKNPGVRREALQFIREVPFNNDVKNTLIYVLLNDTSSGVRIEAMNIISEAAKKGATFNNQDLTIFKENLENDKNNYVRFLAKNIIKEY
jgi:hypothetical protein